MSDAAPFLAVGVLTALVVVVAVSRRALARQRADELATFAETIGFELTNDGLTVAETLGRFSVWKLAERFPEAINVLEGTRDGRRVTLCDFQYEVLDHARRASPVARTLCLIEGGGAGVPAFRVQRKPGAAGRGLTFEDDRRFSAAWVVQGDDERVVRVFFAQPLRDGFTVLASASTVEHAGGVLVVDLGFKANLSDVGELLDAAVMLRRLWS